MDLEVGTVETGPTVVLAEEPETDSIVDFELLLGGSADEVGLEIGSTVVLDAGGCCVLICILVSCEAATCVALAKSPGLSLTGERASPSPLDIAAGSDFT